MTVLWILVIAIVVLGVGGKIYSSLLARWLGEHPTRITPALARADGKDYVATPTPIVFAHHFASIAGAGPIVGPVLAISYGWLPALAWVVLGGLFFGAVHDYLATYISLREDGQSVATIARRVIGANAFIAFVLFLLVMLSLVTAMFLILSAAALTSVVEMSRLKITEGGLFRTATIMSASGLNVPAVVIGGIASTSVIVITAFAPLVGYLYIKKQVAVWKCSVLAVVLCAVSIVAGLYFPVQLNPMTWQLILSGYVLLAAGLPVWLFLQSRDFINVHILYVGLAMLMVVLVAAAATGAGLPNAQETFAIQGLSLPHAVQAQSVAGGEAITKLPIWPMLFITIACGAVSGFHSLCAGGTTCKQLKSEKAARRVGFYAMLLESFLAACVIAVLVVGLDMKFYINDVYPKVSLDMIKSDANPVLAFAMAVGWAGHVSLGAPIVVGALAGMILLEGFVVTTLDTAVRLMRYLLEELWRTLFARYDVFASFADTRDAHVAFEGGENTPAGADGLPVSGTFSDSQPPPASPVATRGLVRSILLFLRHYWVNSGLAVALMLLFAFTGGATALWSIFATANQLLAAMVLLLASLWLLKRKRKTWFAFVPAVFMLATTGASLILLLRKFAVDPRKNATLLTADIVIIALTVFLLIEGIRAAVRFVREAKLQITPQAE